MNWFRDRFFRSGGAAKSKLEAQPVPCVTNDDVERVTVRDYPPGQIAEVRTLLRECGIKGSRIELARVQIACLRLADGKLERLQSAVNVAKQDPRDVLAPAEYPEYCRTAWSKKLAKNEMKRIYSSDWNQYQDWLRK